MSSLWLALIEVLANIKGNPRLFPTAYQLMKVTVGDNVSTDVLAPKELSSNWREDLPQTRALGDSWLARGSSALLGVPSAPSPESVNYLFSPLHADAKRLETEWCKWIEYDKRLFHSRNPS
jgi:RES domain-containing protein